MHTKTLAFVALIILTAPVFAAQPHRVTLIGQNHLGFKVQKIVARPGEKITIRLIDATKLPFTVTPHDVVVLKSTTNTKAFHRAAIAAKSNIYPSKKNNNHIIIAHTKLMADGKSHLVTLRAPRKPGTYTYICTFPGYTAGGMMGKLLVVNFY